MKQQTLKKILSVLLALFMAFQNLQVVPTRAADDESTWVKTTWSEITDGDVIAVTMSKNGKTWVLPNAATGSTPAIAEATFENDVLNVDPALYGWTAETSESGFALKGSGGYLNPGKKNNELRANGASTPWTMDSGYLKETKTGRYMGVWIDGTTPKDWRTYTTIHANIAGETLQLWKLSGGTTPDPDPDPDPEPTVELVDISAALAGADGTTYKVKGVVTMVDGKNVYVQDTTGGICAFFDATPSGIDLGDTIIVTGSKTVYKGLPELGGATFEESSGLTLEAKATTIDALSTSDVCTYVELKNLEVTEVYDNNGSYSAPNITVKDEDGSTIQLYKAKVNKVDGAWEYAVGDKIDVKAAVGIYNTTLQLRNTLASEITKLSDQPDDPEPTVEYDTVAEALAGAQGTSFTVKAVVTMVDGKNIYVQDETGGIDLYFDNAPSNISLGDTVVATGNRATYKGLPELSGATCEKSSGLTLSAKSTTIGALTNADVCTYVELKDLEVTEVYDNNGGYSNPNVTFKDSEGKTIQLYKGVVEKVDGAWALAVGDKVNIKAAVGINNTTLQLRNTLTSEITKVTEEEDVGLVTDLADLKDGDHVVIYNQGHSLAITSETYNNWYLLGSAATIEEDKVVNPDDNQVWEVKITEDGYYKFVQDDKAISAWLSGTYVELTNNPAYNTSTVSEWELEVCNAETNTYYVSAKNLTTSYGKSYIEAYYKKQVSGDTFCGYSTSTSKLTEEDFGMQFYKVKYEEPDEPEPTGDLVTNLNQLKDGTTVAIYSPGHKTAISTKPNGDWYLKANAAIVENGKVVNFTSDFVWVIKKNADGTFTFVSNDDNTKSILVWPSGNYAELTVNAENYSDGDNTWTLTPAKTANCFYASSPTISGTSGSAYIEAYVRNEFEVFSGYFTSPSSNKFTESEFALQFYLVNPEDAVEAVDDGEWDGVLEKGGQYVAYNDNAKASIGLFKEANYSMDAIPTEIEGNLAVPGNGAYVFKIDTMGRYYSFEVNGKFLATNPEEELLFVEKDEDGKLPETAKWWLKEKEGGYIIYNKEATYNGTPVCIEYYSSVFSGWTFSTKNEVGIYLFNFYKVTDDTKVYEDIVQKPKVIFDCEDSRHLEEDYKVSFSLDDLAPEISAVNIYIAVNRQQTLIEDYETDESRKVYNFVIPAETIDRNEKPREFDLHVEVTNSYDISYEGVKKVAILDEPFFEDMTPAPNAQTHEDKKPVISVKVGNVGENPVFKMTVNGKEVKAVYENGVLSYTPAEDMEDGRVSVAVNVTREDGVTAETSWNFIVGDSVYQLYFGQLHSHTTYSDGSGSLETALDYIANLPESANVQFVAFTDHSNYFDTTSASNPADAMNDKSLMTDASRAVWETYKGTVASFNEKHNDLIAIAGYEMTWSGGPGHINSFNTDGLVSRNNAELNNKAGDAGMKLYYDTMIKDLNTLHQFNHPGTTFGNFTDFNYWNEEYDKVMFLVEVGNGEGQIGAGGYYPSYEQYTLALDKGWHVAPTNNQDNHKGRWGNANDARDVVMVESFTEEGIYDAIRNLRVYATEDKNLEITYTVNGDPMGTVYAAENIPEKLDVQVTVYDPDSSDSVSKVELIVDGGKVAHTWDNAEELVSGELTAELSPEYTYYYVRVTQKDGDLAVTAPVWTGLSIKMGINEIKSKDDDKVYTGKEATLVTTLFNNEDTAATVKSLTYTVNGSEVIGTDTEAKTLPANGTLEAEFKHVFSKAKITEVEVTAIIELDGKEYEYKANVELDVIDEETENVVTPIADVRAASNPKDTGYRFVIEGVVTSNASGYDKDTAFFDCVYVQDETGGICVFPVSGNYKIGDKVRIVGHTDFYQGEPELQVKELEVIGEGSVDPEEITSEQLTSREVEGKLVTLKGVIESVEEANGLIQTIMVRDEAGNLARVFIDGYITTAKEVVDALVGANVEATGLASYDNTWADTENFPRIRIRDRADIVCTLPEYSFKEGEYTYTLGSEEAVELPSDIPADQFKEVKVGENALTGDDYEVKEDGTLVLKPEYLETLEPGEYTVTVTTDFGEVTVTFTVEEAAPETFKLNVEDPEHGTITVEPEKDEYTKGEEVTLTITPDEGYEIGEVLVNGEPVEVGEDGTIKITVDGETSVSVTFNEVPAEEVEYKIIEGANQTYIKGTNKDLLIVSDAPFEKFVEVRVDGKVVDKANYTAVSGSTEVTLKASYVETLAEGKHTFTIVSNDGEASTNLTVKAAEQPGTGVSGMNPIWYSAFYAAIIGMFFALIRRKQED